MEELKAAFFRTYANLPLNARDGIVAVVGGEPITWSVAYLEIKSNSPKTAQILNELKELELI